MDLLQFNYLRTSRKSVFLLFSVLFDADSKSKVNLFRTEPGTLDNTEKLEIPGLLNVSGFCRRKCTVFRLCNYGIRTPVRIWKIDIPHLIDLLISNNFSSMTFFCSTHILRVIIRQSIVYNHS